MTGRTWRVLGVIIGASAIGWLVTHFARRWEPDYAPPACAVQTFDHVSFLRVVDAQETATSQRIAQLTNPSDPIEVREAAYLAVKLQGLQLLGPLVEEQFRRKGSTYSCVELGTQLFTTTLDYPTLGGLSRQAEMDHWWALVQRDLARPWWVTFTQGAAGNLATALVAIAGLIVVERRERRRAEQRIVVADKLP